MEGGRQGDDWLFFLYFILLGKERHTEDCNIYIYMYIKVLELFELFELLKRHALQITFLTCPVIQKLHFSQLMSQSGPAEVTGHIRITLDRRYVWKVLIFCHVYKVCNHLGDNL